MQLIVEGHEPIIDPDDKALEAALHSLVGNEGKAPGFANLNPERSGEGDGNFFMRVTGGPHTFILNYRDGIEKREYRSANKKFTLETALSVFLDYGRGNEKSWKKENLWLQKISSDELKKILNAHQKWVEGGKQGDSVKLNKTILKGEKLRETKLQGIDLSQSDLEEADLCYANLEGAELWAANLRKAKLWEVPLCDADLQEADLTDAQGLLAGQFARANVSGAKLPADIHEFEGLSHVEETSRNARKIFFSMLLGCVYSWLTIATTTDARLLTNSASSPLPIIQTQIPIAGFYWVKPVILLSLYIYFHLYLLRLWRGLAALPAVFPDGKKLDERAYPWLLNGLVRAHFVLLKNGRPPLSRLENFIAIVLAWWVVPATLLLFWGRYLPRHEWWGTGLHVGLIAISIGFWILSQRLARMTLRGQKKKKYIWKEALKDVRTYRRSGLALGTIGIGIIFSFLSIGAINGVPSEVDSSRRDQNPKLTITDIRRLVPRLFALIRYAPFAHLVDADVSTKPSSWTGMKQNINQEISLVKEARLAGKNLQFSKASRAFLVKANLRYANLYGADLSWADLRRADLQGADLTLANLQFAKLSEVKGLTKNQVKKARNWVLAVFDDDQIEKLSPSTAERKLRGYNGHLTAKNLEGVELHSIRFEDADLRAVNFDKATLLNANFQRANLYGASLREINLKGANLRNADLQEANLGGANLKEANLHSANLQETDLRRANLQRANLRRANLQGAKLRGANFQGANLLAAKGLTVDQVLATKNWDLAFYSDNFLKELPLKSDHNETLPNRLAKLEKEQKEVANKR